MNTAFNKLFIFELANNHQGDVSHGRNIIRAMGRLAQQYSINAAIKFQYRDLDSFIHPQYRDRKDVPHIPRFLETRLTDLEFITLINEVRSHGLRTVCTPFDEQSVVKAIDHGIEILKVASCSAQDWPLLEAIAGTSKPVIVSTGGLKIQEIDSVVSFLQHREVDFALMHCVAIYPTPVEQLQLGVISKLIRRYPGVPIGYSGHESPTNTDVVKVAISKGASILERHVGYETETIRLNSYSMNPEQTEAWITAALNTTESIGSSDNRTVAAAETESLRSLKRGVYAARDIRAGEAIKRGDVFFAMPCNEGQTTSGEFGQYRTTFIASKNYSRLAAIEEHNEPDVISFTREIIHETKGLICEANIKTGDDVEIELSHHFGISKFRESGAVLVNIINREYCQKIVVVLPGQEHPSHLHRIKEETFQLLWGELKVQLADEHVYLKPGDKLLVPPGVFHSFKSESGAIFQEISTRSLRNDSYYEDERIRTLDPMERKTILDSW